MADSGPITLALRAVTKNMIPSGPAKRFAMSSGNPIIPDGRTTCKRDSLRERTRRIERSWLHV
eukprot:4899485-Amphidinium_carterae.1